MTSDASAGSGNSQLRIALHFPDGSELLWVTTDSPLVGWVVGQAVTVRSTSWVVLGRTENEGDGSITFKLGVA